MVRIGMSAWAACYVFAWLDTGAAGQGEVPHRQLQAQDSTCSGTRELTVTDSSSGPSEVRSALAEAGGCAQGTATTPVFFSVRWEGSIQTDEPFIVPRGVELRVVGDGWFSSYYDISDVDGGGIQEADAELKVAIADAAATVATEGQELEPSVISSSNGTTGLFIVEAGGALSLSKVILSGAWGGNGGGGAVHSVGGKVTGEDIWWRSLSAEGPGGAILARDGAKVTLKGFNLFQGCSSLSLVGGALYFGSAAFSVEDSAQVFFESCSAGVDGGGVGLSNSTLTSSSNSKTRFRNCSAGDNGGGLYAVSASVHVGNNSSLEFQGCAAADVGGARGGGMYSVYSSVSVGAGGTMAFVNNSAPQEDGGGLYGLNTYIEVAGDGAALVFTDNYSGDSGGGLSLEGLETDDSNTDCIALAEGSTASFSGNIGLNYGGGIFLIHCYAAFSGSVSFKENVAQRAGALYIDQSGVFIYGDALFVGNSADRWGGAVFLLDSRYVDNEGLRLTGGVNCSHNVAQRSGGCIYIENGDASIVRDSKGGEGASWVGNSAGYDGGVIAVDGGGLRLEGGYASSNSATERGGVLFEIGESTVVWQGGESWNNSAAAGGSLYMSGSAANLTDLHLDGDRTPSGANIFLAGAYARAVNVTVVAPKDLEAAFALRLDPGSYFMGFACSFDQWDMGLPVVVSAGALVMDVCDFSGSSVDTLVHAKKSTATIRNAILGDSNHAGEQFNPSSVLGIGVHTCASIPAEMSCTVPEECENAENGMGIMCPSFTEAATGEAFSLATFNGASPSLVELTVVTSGGASETSSLSEGTQDVYYPDRVTQKLALRQTASTGAEDDPTEGAGDVLWELRRVDGVGGGTEGGQSAGNDGIFAGISPDNFTWTVVPTSGFLVRGQEVTIQLEGTPPLPLDPSTPFAVYNGEVSAEFEVVWWMVEPNATVSSSVVSVESMFYYCREGSYWDGEKCISCVEEMATMAAGEGALDCSIPGVTLDTLPLGEGFWRGDITDTNIFECLNPSACIGGRGIDVSSPFYSSSSSNSDSGGDGAVPVSRATVNDRRDDSRYCVEGHKGAYCSVCADGYRRLTGGQLCKSCSGWWSDWARGMLWVLGVASFLLLSTMVIFLIGGATAVSQAKKKLVRWLCRHRSKSAATAGSTGSTSAPSDRMNRKPRESSFWARLLRALPLQKLKILVVVWQILTQFSNLAEIPYPPSYQRFLNLLDVFNFDITWPLTATCLVGNINFYQMLLAVTLGPLIALAFLGITYAVAMHVHPNDVGQTSSEARRCAVVRHASAGLLVLFLVFSSVSTTVFSTYSCDVVEDLGVSLLRADYSISCDGPDRLFYKTYAAVMILVYPIGIPVLFAVVLLKRRDKINPPLPALVEGNPRLSKTAAEGDYSNDGQVDGGLNMIETIPERGGGGNDANAAKMTANRGGNGPKNVASDGGKGGRRIVSHDSEGSSRFNWKTRRRGDIRRSSLALRGDAVMEREEALQNRMFDPDLRSTMFLWEPYGAADEPDNYYYETIECGRRCLLTGALVFVLPNTAGQAAGACVFAFVSLLAFELLRPHLSHTDGWMYRMGCIVIFFSNFLALMAKADVSDEKAQSQETFGLLLIAVHASMVIAIIAQIYLSMQAASESRDDYIEYFGKKKPSQNTNARTLANKGGDGGGGGGGGGSGDVRMLPAALDSGGSGEGGLEGRASDAEFPNGDANDREHTTNMTKQGNGGHHPDTSAGEDGGSGDTRHKTAIGLDRDESQTGQATAGGSGNVGSPSQEAARYLAAHESCQWLVSVESAVDPAGDDGHYSSGGDEGKNEKIHSVTVSPRTRQTLRAGLANGGHTSGSTTTSDRVDGDGGEEIASFVMSPRTRRTLRGVLTSGSGRTSTCTSMDDSQSKWPTSASAMSSAQSLAASLPPV